MYFLRISLLVGMLLSMATAWAQQDAYLWIKGEQVTLTQDTRSLSVIFETPQQPSAVMASDVAAKQQGARLNTRYSPVSSTDWVLIDLPEQTGKVARDPAQWAAQLGLTGVKSVSYGYLTPDAAPLWFAHQVSYRPGPGFDKQQFEAILASYPGAAATQTRTGIPYIEVKDIADAIPLANALYENGLVAYAQPAFRSPTTLNSGVRAEDFQKAQKTANVDCPSTDPHFSDQFYLENTVTTSSPTSSYPYFMPSLAGTDINVQPAWCISKGNSGITVAVVDEGVEDHEDLENEDGDSRLIGGYYTDPSITGNGAPTYDSASHGQAVAGIVAASHNTLGPSGIAPEVNLLAVHIDKQGSTDLDRADGIMWAYKNGADIILNAWTYSYCAGFPAVVLEDAIDSAQVYGRGGLGSIVVFASGFIFNPGDPTCVQYPANLSNVITVGAIRPNASNTPPDYAPYGPELDLVGVSSDGANGFISVIDRMGTLGYNNATTNGPEYYANKNYFRYFGGTSTASAEVAGVAALILDINPTLLYTDVENILRNTTVDVGATGFDNNFGAGMLDAYAAVLSAQSTFPVEWGYFRGEQAGETIELAWETLSEINNDRFEVQRKMGDDFVRIGEVKGQGTSSTSLTYRFTDPTPQPGENLYRLKQIDLDGAEELGRTIVVNFSGEGVAVRGPYPNPADALARFDIMGQQGRTLTLRLLTINGQTLKQRSWEVQSDYEMEELSLEDLPAGIYLVQISHPAAVLSQKRLIVRP